MQRIIRKIEPSALKLPTKKRVAAYARVSSGKEAMLHSLSAQVSYYSDFIQKHSGWEYVGVYADEALSGTKDNRIEFQRLLAECKNGKIDMVITKSISRLARNTVTMLQTVRELKELNIDVYFEKENIHSMSGDGELMLTILSSFAQEESLSVSENCKWRIRKAFENGELINMRHLFGYTLVNGNLIIDEKQSMVVKRIFSEFLQGKGATIIAHELNRDNIATFFGKEWSAKNVTAVLHNEKYAGNALLQKTYKENHISKKRKLNTGALPQYFVAESHVPIVSEEMYRQVQCLLEHKARKYVNNTARNEYPFTGKIVCGNCGKNYKRRTLNKKIYWNCSTYLSKGKHACFVKQIPEDTLLSVTSGVLGLAEFDEIIFEQQIKEIRVPGPNILIFVFNNCNTVEKLWQNKSRSDSWSDEAKQQAREKQIAYLGRVNSKCKQPEQ